MGRPSHVMMTPRVSSTAWTMRARQYAVSPPQRASCAASSRYPWQQPLSVHMSAPGCEAHVPATARVRAATACALSASSA